MWRVKKACVSSSAIPSWWSTQPSRVTLMLKVKSPMVSSVRDTRRDAPPSGSNRSLRVSDGARSVPNRRAPVRRPGIVESDGHDGVHKEEPYLPYQLAL